MRDAEKLIRSVAKVFTESDAGFGKVVGRETDGTPCYVIIIAEGEQATEVVAAMESLEKKWDDEERA
jgi:hypothetical protein